MLEPMKPAPPVTRTTIRSSPPRGVGGLRAGGRTRRAKRDGGTCGELDAGQADDQSAAVVQGQRRRLVGRPAESEDQWQCKENECPADVGRGSRLGADVDGYGSAEQRSDGDGQ